MRVLLIIVLATVAAFTLQAKQANEKLAANRKAVIDKQGEQLTEARRLQDGLYQQLRKVSDESEKRAAELEAAKAQPLVAEKTPPVQDVINWRSWKDGRPVAIADGLPSLLHFTRGSSCRPCENLRLNVYTDQQVVDASQQFVCVEFMLADDPAQDTPENIAAMKAFGVNRADGIPQDVFLMPGWSTKNFKILGGLIPTDAAGYAKYLNEWAAFLNKGK